MTSLTTTSPTGTGTVATGVESGSWKDLERAGLKRKEKLCNPGLQARDDNICQSRRDRREPQGEGWRESERTAGGEGRK